CVVLGVWAALWSSVIKSFVTELHPREGSDFHEQVVNAVFAQKWNLIGYTLIWPAAIASLWYMLRVLRGGSFSTLPASVRSASRFANVPALRNITGHGFRPARTV